MQNIRHHISDIYAGRAMQRLNTVTRFCTISILNAYVHFRQENVTNWSAYLNARPTRKVETRTAPPISISSQQRGAGNLGEQEPE